MATQDQITADLESGSAAAPKKGWKKLVRFLISAVLLVVVYQAVDVPNLLNTLSRVSLSGALLLLGMYAFGQLISALKWSIFIGEIGVPRPFSSTVRAYFFGMFVNTFGLGTVGGDVARSLALLPPKGKRAACLATVVADRLHGLGVLLTIGAVSIIAVRPVILEPYGAPLAVLAVVGLALMWWYGPRLLTRIFPASHKYGHAAREAANAFPRRARPFLAASVISAFFHCVQIGMHAVIAHEFAVELSLPLLFCLVPLVNVASSLPLSINGLGIREGMYMLLFVPMGLPPEVAVAFGAVWILTVTAVSALGGVLLPTGIDRGQAIANESALEAVEKLEQKQAVG